MLGKKIKYDFKAFGFKTIIGIACTVLAAGMSMVIFYAISKMPKDLFAISSLMGLFGGVMAFLAVIGPFAIAAVMLITRYNQSMAGSESYLTFTLPVKINTHLFSNVVSSLIYTIIAAVFTCINVLLMLFIGLSLYGDNMISQFMEALRSLDILPYLTIILPLTLIMSFIQFLLIAYTAISFSTRFSKNKGVAKVAGYFVINYAITIVHSLIYWGYVLLTGRAIYSSAVNGVFPSIVAGFSGIAQTSLLLSFESEILKLIISFAVFFFVSRYMYTKKINIE